MKKSILKTGAQFTAKDKLNRTYRYEVIGIDLQDYLSGTGCAYIVLKNLNTNTHTYVEMAWFKEREITEINPIRNSIEVPCTAGTLCAEAGGDPDYPEVFTYLRREDGVDIDICAVEGDDESDDILCPFCGNPVARNDDYRDMRPKHCPDCGTKLIY